MEKNLKNNDFKNLGNEKQNSLASGISIGLDEKSPILKQKLLKIKGQKGKVIELEDLNNEWDAGQYIHLQNGID